MTNMQMSTLRTNDNRNHYEILGIGEGADHATIKNAHRKLALQFHPDKRTNLAAQDTNEAETIFTKIQAAWECLGNKEKRMEYDNALSRLRERNNGDIIKAQVVKLCEMKYEICDVEDDESVGTKESQENTKQKLYSFTCRCGDCFEILEEELDDSNIASISNIFECESCSLSIKVVL